MVKILLPSTRRRYRFFGTALRKFVVILLRTLNIVNTRAVDCLERLVSEMPCYVSSRTLTSGHSLVVVFCVLGS